MLGLKISALTSVVTTLWLSDLFFFFFFPSCLTWFTDFPDSVALVFGVSLVYMATHPVLAADFRFSPFSCTSQLLIPRMVWFLVTLIIDSLIIVLCSHELRLCQILACQSDSPVRRLMNPRG